MSKLCEEEVNDLSDHGATSALISMRRNGSHQIVHPLNLQKLWAINSYVLVSDEIVLIECNPLVPFWFELELH
jgi:hypothetical protein